MPILDISLLGRLSSNYPAPIPVASTSPIYVSRPALPPRANYQQYLDRIWGNRRVTNNGPLCRELELRLAERFASPHLSFVTNGTVALQLMLRANALTGGVITTPFSYVATTNALLWEGLRPDFVDIEPHTFCLDPELVEAAIRPDTTAILATHVYGFPCQHERLGEIARRHGLQLFYDAAHAFDVRLNGEAIVGWGDASTLSFHATKVFHTGEGGAVVCSNAEALLTLNRQRAFGHEGRDYLTVGINGKNSELHAAMGLANLTVVDEQREHRRVLSERYIDALADLPQLRCIDVRNYPGLEHNYGYFPIIFADPIQRERTVAVLEAEQVYPRRYFEPSLNELPFLDRELRVPCPVSERAARTALCLPLYADLPAEQVDRIASLVRKSLWV